MSMMKEYFYGSVLLEGMIDEKDEQALGAIMTVGDDNYRIDDYIEYNNGSFAVCLFLTNDAGEDYCIVYSKKAASLARSASKIIFRDGNIWQLPAL